MTLRLPSLDQEVPHLRPILGRLRTNGQALCGIHRAACALWHFVDDGGEPNVALGGTQAQSNRSALAQIAEPLDRTTADKLIANAAHQSRISELGNIGTSIPFVREVLSCVVGFEMS